MIKTIHIIKSAICGLFTYPKGYYRFVLRLQRCTHEGQVDFLGKILQIFNAQPALYLFAKHELYAMKEIKVPLNRGFVKILLFEFCEVSLFF